MRAEATCAGCPGRVFGKKGTAALGSGPSGSDIYVVQWEDRSGISSGDSSRAGPWAVSMVSYECFSHITVAFLEESMCRVCAPHQQMAFGAVRRAYKRIEDIFWGGMSECMPVPNLASSYESIAR